MNRKVLVTGSNGFIGNHVCSYLQSHGIFVIGMGRRNASKGNTDDYVQCNLLNDSVVEKLGEERCSEIDAVVHLAADMRHEPYTVDVTMTNCGGTQKLLELCEEQRIPKFLQLSSLPVIGKPQKHPITEEHAIRPPTVYHVTKYTQELLAEYANYTFGLQTMSFRISAPIGLGMNSKTIFPVFINKALRGEELTLLGKGTRKQTYIHVRDIAKALYLALESDGQGVYNLSSYNLYSNYELARKCIEVLGSKSDIVFLDKDDPMDDYTWDVSLQKIIMDIHFKPEVGMEDAIREYANAIIEKE